MKKSLETNYSRLMQQENLFDKTVHVQAGVQTASERRHTKTFRIWVFKDFKNGTKDQGSIS